MFTTSDLLISGGREIDASIVLPFWLRFDSLDMCPERFDCFLFDLTPAALGFPHWFGIHVTEPIERATHQSDTWRRKVEKNLKQKVDQWCLAVDSNSG